MPRPAIDLTGKTFDRWQVNARVDNGSSSVVRWHCTCSCGNCGIVRTAKLISGSSTGCEDCKYTQYDITGQTFGRLLVIERAGTDTRRGTAWLCQCDCGETTIVPRKLLVAGHTRSCRCLLRESTAARATKHRGCIDHLKEYKVWTAMKQRCLNPKCDAYHNYGGRGITICEEWQNYFAVFFTYMGPCPPGFWIERIDNDGPYAPWNCKWDTPKVNLNNKRWSGRRPTV